MFGHNLPPGIFETISALGRAYVDNDGGKPVISETMSQKTVAVVIKKPDDQVEILTPEERTEMNYIKKPFVLLGSALHISEAYMPDRYTERAPYVNRPFIHGVFDCYTLVRDYYRREFGLWLPTNIQRTFGWWEQGDNLYVDGAAQFDFVQTSAVRRHDVIIMKMGPVPNHGAIYLGDGNILHHIGGRFSCVEKLTPFYRQKIAVVYRNGTVSETLMSIGDHAVEGIE